MAIKVASLVAFIREKGERDAAPNARGNTIVRLFMPDERYTVDFAPDFKTDGWQQFDTDQDAHYFGVWVNAGKRLSLCYAEGDWTLVECPTAETYRAEIVSACEFYGEGFEAKAIDANGRMTTYRQDRAAMFLGEKPDPRQAYAHLRG